MTNDNLILILPLILTTAVSLILATFAWERKSTPGAIPLILIFVGISIWTISYSLEIISLDINQKLMWLNFEYIGILIIPVAFLRFGILISLSKKYDKKSITVLSGISSLLLLILVFTNPYHHWFQSDHHIEFYKSIPFLSNTKGPIFWILNFSVYTHFLLSFVAIFTSFSPQNKLMRNQYISILIAAIPPLLANILNIFGILFNPLLDITPFAIFFSGIAISFGFFKYKLLDITPIARNNLIEKMQDGVLVLSPEKFIIDVNPSFKNFFEFSNFDIIGREIKDIFIDKPVILQDLEYHISTKSKHSFNIENKNVDYKVNISPLIDKRNVIIGQLIVFQDVTKELKIERENKEIEERYQLLIEQTPVAVGIHCEEKLVYFNQAGLDLFGASENDKILGKDIYSLIHPDYFEIAKERVISTYIEKIIREKIEIKMIRLDGKVIDVEAMNLPIDFKGKPASQVILTDITDRKENFRQRQRQFKELTVLHEIANLGSKTNSQDEFIRKATNIIGETVYHDNFGLLFVENFAIIKELHTYRKDKRDIDLLTFKLGEGVTGEVAQKGEMINVPDVSKYKNYIPINPLISSELCVPIKINNQTVGIINAESNQLNAFSSEDEEFLLVLADQLSIVLEKIRLFEEIKYLAKTDFLTGISNRRNFIELANVEFERTTRYKNNLTAIILDLDDFKKVNDTHGHTVGDKILIETASKIIDQLRDTDIFCRYGGEEFAILFPQTDLASTQIIAERLLKAFNDNPIKTSKGLIRITVSIGIAEISKEDNDIHDLLNHADIALYQAKETGRNKICEFNKVNINK